MKSAPFGLEWGLSAKDLKQSGVHLIPLETEDLGASFIAEGLPKRIRDIVTVFVSFSNDKLWRIAAVSQDYDNDPAGYAVRRRYDQLLSTLTQKYGEGTSMHHSVWGDDDFLLGIQSGRSTWSTFIENQIMTIILMINARSDLVGYWQIVFEQKELQLNLLNAQQKIEMDTL
jgi:hypothetical protein